MAWPVFGLMRRPTNDVKKGLIKSIALVSSLVLVPGITRADITYTIDAADLRTAGGSSLMSTNGLMLFVVSTTDSSFAAPTASSFVSGDDTILLRTNLDSGFGDGFFEKTLTFTLSGQISPSDPVQLYWYPTLTLADASPGGGTTYGQYRSDVGQSQSRV